MNVSSSNLPLASMSSVGGVIIAIITFIIVLLLVFLLSKNIRQFFYGAVASGILLLNFKFSLWVGTSYAVSNFKPIRLISSIAAFIVVSVFLGRILQKTSLIKKWEKVLK